MALLFDLSVHDDVAEAYNLQVLPRPTDFAHDVAHTGHRLTADHNAHGFLEDLLEAQPQILGENDLLALRRDKQARGGADSTPALSCRSAIASCLR